jgi:hypothetical protein
MQHNPNSVKDIVSWGKKLEGCYNKIRITDSIFQSFSKKVFYSKCVLLL